MSETKDQALSGVAETLLIPLCYRAIETQRPDAMIKDEKAVELIKQLSSDGSIRYDSDWIKQTPMAESNKVMRIMLTREMDRYTRDFLSRHPEAVVVHVGCGLDSRFDRLAERNSQVEWYDLDLPEVIELRRKLIGDEGGRYHLLSCSVLEEAWLEAVRMHRGRPFLFLAEGVFMYFTEAQVKSLVLTLRDHFPGAELVFDGFSPLVVWANNRVLKRAKIHAHYSFALMNGKDLEGWGGGIRLLKEWRYFDCDEPRLANVRWARHIPLLAKSSGIFHYRLGGST